jgi:hypothetical protein
MFNYPNIGVLAAPTKGLSRVQLYLLTPPLNRNFQPLVRLRLCTKSLSLATGSALVNPSAN